MTYRRDLLNIRVVVRPGAGTDFRGYAGRLESGVIRVGDEVVVLPANRSTRIRAIVSLDRSLPLAFAVYVYVDHGSERGTEYLTGYRVEKSLSVAIRSVW